MANEISALDSSPLGRLVHPRQNAEISDWLDSVLANGATFYIPEIIEYELRRALLFGGLTRSLEKLDELEEVLPFLPLDRATMLDAAELWAQARRQGKSVADPKELDGDAILAAQARRVGAVVITENVGHLSIWVDARDWRETEQLSRAPPIGARHQTGDAPFFAPMQLRPPALFCHHAKVLAEVGLVRKHKQGRTVFYSLDELRAR